MPPGTGYAQLSHAQILPLTGGILVTTPQAVSTFDVTKAIGMFNQVNVEILGIVENMAGLSISGTVEGAVAGTKVHFDAGTGSETIAVDDAGKFQTVVPVFGSGGAERLAQTHGFPILGQIPLDPAVRVGGDGGDPIAVSDPDSIVAKVFVEIAGRFAQRVAIREHASLPILQ